MNKKNTWTKKRHRVIFAIVKFFGMWHVRRKYNITLERCEALKGRQSLLLFNHVTAYDQFFVADAVNVPVYFIASEDIFSIGWLSKLMSWAVAPIPIKKQAQDVKALKTCLKVVKEGGTIALSPEGNRTYSGKLCYIKATVVAMAKRFKLPIACYRIEGGFGKQPRWSDTVRGGSMRAYVSRIIEPEEYKAMSDEELMTEIVAELDVNETGNTGEYEGEHLAEYLERAMYVCPDCGLSRFESHGNEFNCTNCKLTGRYTATKELVGAGREFPFRVLADWY
ncbi:MAG: 1-acyl-sn-glycerol-3-phosphate acyltransferase, partial [Clostridiales bacterium]|nr:1-acyl-sn-glycerol-3-phosphate acyltransferase [Candidatus Crickella merdequi]